MAETLGSLCRQAYHSKAETIPYTEDIQRLESLAPQEKKLSEEIVVLFIMQLKERNLRKIIFSSNKVYKREGNEINEITGTIGKIFSELYR